MLRKYLLSRLTSNKNNCTNFYDYFLYDFMIYIYYIYFEKYNNIL
jgi:hypothetical protein